MHVHCVRIFALLFLSLFVAGLTAVAQTTEPASSLPYLNPSLSTNERVDDLVARMTLSEELSLVGSAGVLRKGRRRDCLLAGALHDRLLGGQPVGVRRLRQRALEREPAHLPVGHYLETRLLLEANGHVDRPVLDGFEVRRGDCTCLEPAARLDELRRSQQAAHHVGVASDQVRPDPTRSTPARRCAGSSS